MIAAAMFWLAFVNVVTLLRFWQDKQAAIAGRWRVREADLLSLAVIGGTPAAYAARRLFRHKTRKQPFSTYLALVAVIQLGAAAGLTIPQ